jgi:hypothetical protein
MTNQDPISEDVQKELNKPLANPQGMSIEDQKILDLVIKYVNEGRINLYEVDSVINHDIFDKLDLKLQSKVEIEALTVLSLLREIKGLYDAGFVNTYQLQNLVQRLRLYVEDIEETGGDVFII